MKKRLVCGDIHGHFDTFLEIYNEENPDADNQLDKSVEEVKAQMK
mgnify:CR=1 FL=1